MQQLLGYVLGLILLATAGYTAYDSYQEGRDNTNIQTVQTQVSQIAQQVINQYQRRPGRYQFGALTTATMISSKIIPQSAINGTAVTNPFNGVFYVVGNGTGGAATPVSTFSILVDNIPEADCEQLIKQSGSGGGLTGGLFYGYAVQATGATTGIAAQSTVIPDTDANASSFCGTASSNGTTNTSIQFIING